MLTRHLGDRPGGLLRLPGATELRLRLELRWHADPRCIVELDQALATLGGLAVSPHSLRAASSGASITTRKSGARVSYTDSQASTTTLTVLRSIAGFKAVGRCVAKRPAGKRRVGRCTLYRRMGSFRHADAAGSNSFAFSGRIRGRQLRPGAYRLDAVPVFAGRSGVARSAGFRVVR